MNILEFEVVRATISAVAANCDAELMKNVQDIKDWIRSLEYVDDSEAQAIFPKTPTAARKTRKRPMVATILEDEEVSDWTVVNGSPEKRVRGSRAASKNASTKLKEMNQNLTRKLRRPTDFDKRADTSVVEAVVPPKRQRRQQDSVASAASSLGTSFSSARSTLSKRQSVAILPCETVTSGREADVIDVEDDVTDVNVEHVVDSRKKQPTASRACVVASAAKPSGGDVTSSEDEEVFLAELAKMKKLRKSSRRTSHTVKETTVTTTTVNRSTTTVDRPTTSTSNVVVVNVPVVISESSDEESVPLSVVMANLPYYLSPVVKLTTLSPAELKQMSRRQQQTPISVKKRVAAYEKEVLAVEPPAGRMTRTKTKAMASGSGVAPPHVVQKADISLLQKLARKSLCKAIKISKDKDRKIQEADKENSFIGQPAKPVSALLTAAKVKNTPFSSTKPQRMVLTSASTNRITVNQSASHSTFIQDKSTCSNVLSGLDSFISKPKVVSAEEVEEKRRDERKRREEKEEEAVRKKKEMMERKIEMQKKKREEKLLKVLASREAIEREKLEQQVRAEREKVEKVRQALEREERLREEIQRKKLQAQQKAAEIEERRRLDEAQRQQRIKEQEEEQKRLAAARKREMEEVERQMLRRQQEEREEAAERERAAKEAAERGRAMKAAAEAKEKQRAAYEAKEKQRAAMEAREKQQKAVIEAKMQQGKPAAAAALDGTFVVPGTGRPPLRVASLEDCELLDLSAGDSESEDERGTVPRWADHKRLKETVKKMEYVNLNAYSAYFGSHPTTPNLCEVFGNPKLREHKRTSSAVWKTMPRYSMMPKDL